MLFDPDFHAQTHKSMVGSLSMEAHCNCGRLCMKMHQTSQMDLRGLRLKERQGKERAGNGRDKRRKARGKGRGGKKQ